MRVKMRKLREGYGFTQQTFSEAIGISRTHYTQVETGEKQPSLRLALRIKQALNYYGDDLFDNTSPVQAKIFLPNKDSKRNTVNKNKP